MILLHTAYNFQIWTIHCFSDDHGSCTIETNKKGRKNKYEVEKKQQFENYM